MKQLSLFCQTEQGGGLVEYTLVIMLIAIVALIAITEVGTELSDSLTEVADALD